MNDLNNKQENNINLFVFLDIINCNLELRRFANQSGRWLAKIENGEIKNGNLLSGIYGNGNNPKEAIMDYVKQIKGKLLIINAINNNRKEFKVPDNLFFDYL